jgi:hypothetical protein
MPNLNYGLITHEALRAELQQRWPELQDDEQTLSDTLEGISSLPEMIAAVLRSAIEDELLVAGIREHIGGLKVRQKRLQDRVERKKAMALHYAQEGRLKRIPAPDFTASVGMGGGRVLITDETALADEWVRIKREPDKEKIGKALKAGVIVPGAELSNPVPWLSVRTT